MRIPISGAVLCAFTLIQFVSCSKAPDPFALGQNRDATVSSHDGHQSPDGDCCTRDDSGIVFDAGDTGLPYECGIGFHDACRNLYGEPPVCEKTGQPREWLCPEGYCVLSLCEPVFIECGTDCDCPWDQGCGDGICGNTGHRNRCCEHPVCRPGEACIHANGQWGRCGEVRPDGGIVPPRRDGGVIPPRRDGGPNGQVGDSCRHQSDCLQGLDCPGIDWPGGYCTIENCDPPTVSCPSGSACYSVPGYSLCLETCPNGGTRSTCRPGYYCFGPSGREGACVPED